MFMQRLWIWKITFKNSLMFLAIWLWLADSLDLLLALLAERLGSETLEVLQIISERLGVKFLAINSFVIAGNKLLADITGFIFWNWCLNLINLVCQDYVVNGDDLSWYINTLDLDSLDIEYVCDHSKLTCVFAELDRDKATELNESRENHIEIKSKEWK